MINTNIKALVLVVSDKNIFHVPYISLYKTCDPRAANFWPQGLKLNKLGNGLLGDATYKISRL